MSYGNEFKRYAKTGKNIDDMFKAANEVVKTVRLDLDDILKDLGDIDILVGIPEDKSARKSKKRNKGAESLTNSELAFLHTNGIRSTKMIKEMDKTMGGVEKGKNSYSKAYKLYLQSHGSPAYKVPPRPIIEPAIEEYSDKIAEKYEKAILTFIEKGRKEGIDALKAIGLYSQGKVRGWFTNDKNGWMPNSPITIAKKKSDRPLIDTGELRKSIVYVIRDKKGDA